MDKYVTPPQNENKCVLNVLPVNGCTFMVSSEKKEVVWVFHLVCQQQAYRLQRPLSSTIKQQTSKRATIPNNVLQLWLLIYLNIWGTCIQLVNYNL